MKRKLFLILLFVLLPSFLNVREPINASVSLDDFAYDNYILYDQSGEYAIANLSFSTQISYNNDSNKFYIYQTVKFETISSILTNNWGLISINFTTEKVFGWWSVNETHMYGTLTIPYTREEEVELKINEEETVSQEIEPPDFWSGDTFTFRPSFRNIFLNLKKGSICEVNKYVYFQFRNYDIETSPIINGKWIINYEIKAWEILKEEILSVIVIILVILFVILIIQIYTIAEDSDNLLIMGKTRTVNEENIRKWKWNSIIHSICWIIILITSIVSIFWSVYKLEPFKFGSVFFIINSCALVLVYLSTFFIREQQNVLNKKLFLKLKKSKKIEYFKEFMTIIEAINVPYPNVRDIILIIIVALLTPILENIVPFIL